MHKYSFLLQHTLILTGLIILYSKIVCIMLSVSVDEWKKQASSDKSKQMKNSEKREGESLSTSFQIPQSTHHLAYFPKNHFSCQNVKCRSSKVWCRRVLSSTCMLDSGRMKPNDWQKCWSKLSQLTNHREGTGTVHVYWKEVLETMLTAGFLLSASSWLKMVTWRFKPFTFWGNKVKWETESLILIAYSTQLPSRLLLDHSCLL